MAKKEKAVDAAAKVMLERVEEKGLPTAWQRAEAQSPHCRFGTLGLCCRLCFLGPCRISPTERGAKVGVCGADAATIAARNFLRMVAGGAAAHSDHGRAVAEIFLQTARGDISGYQIKDIEKLRMVAGVLGVETEGKDAKDIAIEVGERALAEFGKQEGEQLFAARAPETRQKVWHDLGIYPRGIDREIVEAMHRTSMGVDQDPRSLMRQASRLALADGWGGSMIATELQDILFGTPIPLKGQVNLGVLKEDQVNIVVHGHEPILSEMVALASQDEELIKAAQKVGAKGINIAGICCTANELLMRHGIPIAGNMKMQELVIATGVVDAIIVDVQCIMQGLGQICGAFHTKFITTSSRAHITGAEHIEFEEDKPLETAKRIVWAGIENFAHRNKDAVFIPDLSNDLIAGFSHETVNYILGGRFRASYVPLNDNIVNGRIRGVAGVVGCTNLKAPRGSSQHTDLVKELISRDVLVVETGCAAIECGKAGLLLPEAKELAGPGLKEVCEAVGMPPVLHAGSCVDNSRILIALTEMVNTGGLGEDISELPVAGACLEWMHEKAISIGQYFVASGVYTIFGIGSPVAGSEELMEIICKEFEGELGGMWAFEADPHKMAEMICAHIERKRDALGINVERERKLYDMEDRRKLSV